MVCRTIAITAFGHGRHEREIMRAKGPYSILLLLAVIPALNSCLSYEEELWVNRDGSGSAHFRIIVSQMLAQVLKETNEIPSLEGSLTTELKEIDGLRVVEAKAYERAGNSIWAVKVDFDSWEHLKDIRRSTENGGQDSLDFLGVVSLKKDEKERLVYSRTVGTRKQKGGDTEKETKEENPFTALGAGLMQGMLSGYTWKYTVHFPAQVVSANTADEDIDKLNNTVTWQVSLGSVVNEPYTMTAILDPSVGKMTYGLIGAAAVMSIVLVIWIMRATASSRSRRRLHTGLSTRNERDT